jgi:hypothetical protein
MPPSAVAPSNRAVSGLPYLCSMRRAYLDQLRKTASLLRGQPLPPPPAEVEERLTARPPPATLG